MEKDMEFVRVAQPNMDELAMLVTKAKGQGRSLRKFAQECGVCASTLSRIINKENKGASSEELIRAIASHADLESGITLDALMGANGMARILGSSTVYKTSEMEIETKFKGKILSELEHAGCTGWKDEARFNIGITLQSTLDFVIYFRTIEGGIRAWGFELIHLQPPERGDGTEKDSDYALNMYGYRILDRIGRILPLFYKDELSKISFVITNDKCFDYIVSEFADYRVPFNMSFIMFNCQKEIIGQEFILKQPDGRIPKSILNNR